MKMKKMPNRIILQMKKYSPFCQKVWTECFNIPKGETISYGQLAKKIGHPKAARAVGRALGLNPFAPIIPCHRVVRADGELGGYSAAGGTAAKKKLLESENKKVFGGGAKSSKK